MPIAMGSGLPQETKPLADVVPDINVDSTFRVDIKTEMPLEKYDENWTDEQKREWELKYRFQGIRCRGDVKGKTIPISKQTMDLP